MIYNEVYQCPKCYNTLLVSNKLLHDLRCTVENPATYENILYRQSLQVPNNDSSLNIYKSMSGGRTSFKNEDGTMIDIVREKNIRGKEELIETKYDPQGNIITRKRADTSRFSLGDSNLHEFSEITLNNYNYNNDYDTRYDNNNNTYYEVNKEVEEVRKKPSVIVETAEAQEIVYEAPVKYDPHVTINQPIYDSTYINNNTGYSNETYDNITTNTNNGFSNFNDTNTIKYDYSKNNQYKTTDYKNGYKTNEYKTTGYKTTDYKTGYNNDYKSDYKVDYKTDYNQNYDMYNFDNQIKANAGESHKYKGSYNKKDNKKYSMSKKYSEYNSYDYQY